MTSNGKEVIFTTSDGFAHLYKYKKKKLILIKSFKGIFSLFIILVVSLDSIDNIILNIYSIKWIKSDVCGNIILFSIFEKSSNKIIQLTNFNVSLKSLSSSFGDNNTSLIKVLYGNEFVRSIELKLPIQNNNKKKTESKIVSCIFKNVYFTKNDLFTINTLISNQIKLENVSKNVFLIVMDSFNQIFSYNLLNLELVIQDMNLNSSIALSRS